MSLARKIWLFVNFAQGQEIKILKVRENSVIFDVFFRVFAVSHVIKVEIEKKRKRSYELTTPFYFILQKTVAKTLSGISPPPVFAYSRKKAT